MPVTPAGCAVRRDGGALPAGELRGFLGLVGGERIEISAGGIVARRARGGLEVLLGDQTDWNTGAGTTRLPKGHLEPGETLEAAALREVAEETGRRARILEALAAVEYRYENRRTGETIQKRVHFFLMADEGPDDGARDDEMERLHWAPLAEAPAALTFETERELVRSSASRLETLFADED